MKISKQSIYRGGISFEKLKKFGIKTWHDIGKFGFDDNITKC